MPNLRDHLVQFLLRDLERCNGARIRDADIEAQDELIRTLTLALRQKDERLQRMREKGEVRERQHQTLKRRYRGLKKKREHHRRRARLLRERSRQLRLLRRQASFVPSTNTESTPFVNFGWFAEFTRYHDELAMRRVLAHPLRAERAMQQPMRLGTLHQYEPRPLVPLGPPLPKAPRLPAVCVVTPSYNQAEYLEQTMRSVLDQRYPGTVEYVVMDGGSGDGSVGIIQRHADRLHHWQSAPDGGQAAAVKAGFEKSDAPYMCWLNSDDLFLGESLAHCVDYLERHPAVDLVYGHRVMIDGGGKEIGRWVMPRHSERLLWHVDIVPQETCVWRRSAYDRAGGIDPSFRFALDWDFLLRVQSSGGRIRRLPWFLGAFRCYPEQKTSSWLDVAAVELERLRQRELGEHYDEETMRQLLRAAQVESVWLQKLLRRGIRL